MRGSLRSILVIGLAATLAVTTAAAQDAPPLESMARIVAITAESAATPEAALAGQAVRTSWRLPELAITVHDTRSVLADGMVGRTTTLDDGTFVDLDALRAADHALGLQRRGGMTPELHVAVGALDAGETLEVAFWLIEPSDGIDVGRHVRDRAAGVPRELVGAAVRAARREALAMARDRYAPGNADFESRVRSVGGEVTLVAGAWPVVIARVDAEQARALAAEARVDEAYISYPEWLEEGNFAQGTMRTPVVWDQGVLADGSVKVMVNDTAQVELDNAWLPPVIALNSSSVASHATGVAGNICNIHPTYRAASYTLPEIYTAGGSGDSAAPPIWETAVATGIDFGNCSWWNGHKGSIAFLDRFFDHTIRNFSVMMFKSTGNQGNTSEPYTTTPGNGFNMTNSGAYTDQDNSTWGDDAMASSSSYWDPVEGHEKPEIASPGTCVATTSTTSDGLTGCFGGTSSASPLTCGVATLLASGDNTLLAQMTTVKAVLMASAWHNVEAEALLSEKDGAGGVHAAAAWALVRDGHWWYDDVEFGDFPHGKRDIPVTLTGGSYARVVALWFSNPDEAFSTDVLDMDLDMTILDPSGAVVTSSLSATNPFEIVSFRAPVTGTYTVRLTRTRFDGTSEPLTVAWSTRSDTMTASVSLAGLPFDPPFAVGETPTLLFKEPFEGANRPYVAAASFTAAPDLSLPGGWIYPIGVDEFTFYSLGLPGFIGNLSANGQALASFPIPDDPGLAGLELSFALVVLGPSGGINDIVTMSPATPIVIQP